MRALAFALSLALLCPPLLRAQDDEPVTVDEAGLVSTTLVDVPLAEALLQLAEAADVSLLLPSSTLEWVDLRVTARLRGVPLPAAFELLLKVCHLKGRLETAGETKVLLVDLPPQEALALANLELAHAQVVAERAELQARVVERELELRRLQDEANEEMEEEEERDDELGEDSHEHRRFGPVQGDDGEWEDEDGGMDEERDEDEGERGEQLDEDESRLPAPGPSSHAVAAPRRDVFFVPVTVTVVEEADPNARKQAYVRVYKWDPESASYKRAGFAVEAGDKIGAVKKVPGGEAFDFSTGVVLVDTFIESRQHPIIPDHKRQVQGIRVRFPDGSLQDFTDVDRPAELGGAPRQDRP